MSDTHAQTVPFVRDKMLPASEPPRGERGAILWLRTNLLSSWSNVLLSVISAAVIVWAIWAIYPWLANSVWFGAKSLDECRQILNGVPGACFAVITERWQQLLYGFYPPELYWRANLTLLLLMVALAPVLFADLQPRTRAIVASVLFVLSGLMVWGSHAEFLGLTRAIVLAVFFAAVAVAIWRFDLTRRFMFLFTMLFPFVLVWLVWGGTVWAPLSALAGFGFGWLSYRVFGLMLGTLFGIIAAAVGTVLFWLVIGPWLVGILNRGVSNWQLVWIAVGSVLAILVTRHPALAGRPLVQLLARIALVIALAVWAAPLLAGLSHDLVDAGRTSAWGIEAVQSRKLGGFMVSIIIGIAGIALSLPIGIVLALGRRSDLFIVHTLCVMFIEFVRGVPLITLLFTASLLLNYFLPPGTNFDIILRVIIMVTLFASAYMAEVIRGGLAALPKGQYEAADSLGLDYWKAQRLVIMPQALKISIPGIVNTFIGLFKDTTLVTFIGILDILNFTNSIRANAEWHGIYWELYIFVGLMFFITCFTMGRYSKWLELKLRTDNH